MGLARLKSPFLQELAAQATMWIKSLKWMHVRQVEESYGNGLLPCHLDAKANMQQDL